MGVVIGMDPHKRTVTIEVMDADEQILGHRQFTTDITGFEQMLVWVRQWPERVWAVEGCNGIGHHVAMSGSHDDLRNSVAVVSCGWLASSACGTDLSSKPSRGACRPDD